MGFFYGFMKEFSAESRCCCEGAGKVLSTENLWVSSTILQGTLFVGELKSF